MRARQLIRGLVAGLGRRFGGPGEGEPGKDKFLAGSIPPNRQ